MDSQMSEGFKFKTELSVRMKSGHISLIQKQNNP